MPELDPRKRENVTVGSLVEINTNPPGQMANFVKGRIDKVITEEDFCEDGIFVKLEQNVNGNITKIIEYIPSEIDPDLEKIQRGESETVEFKESFMFDVKRFRITEDREIKEELKDNIPKAIAGFANKNGGILYLGVSDSGTISGLENDFDVMQVNADGFERVIRDFIKNAFNRRGERANDSIFDCIDRPKMIKLNGKSIYKISVKRSVEKPCIVYKDVTLSEGTQTVSLPIFYVRQTTTTQPQNPAEFIQMWKSRE